VLGCSLLGLLGIMVVVPVASVVRALHKSPHISASASSIEADDGKRMLGAGPLEY
jgi:hypothetical protein